MYFGKHRDGRKRSQYINWQDSLGTNTMFKCIQYDEKVRAFVRFHLPSNYCKHVSMVLPTMFSSLEPDLHFGFNSWQN